MMIFLFILDLSTGNEQFLWRYFPGKTTVELVIKLSCNCQASPQMSTNVPLSSNAEGFLSPKISNFEVKKQGFPDWIGLK